MALYEFECKACGKRFELSLPMHDHDRLRDKPPACPQCGKTETHQTVSVFSCKTPAA